MRLAYTCVLFLLLFSAPALSQTAGNSYRQWFAEAEKLANADNPTAQSNKTAFELYNKTIRQLATNKTDDPFLFRVYVNTGVFLQVLNQQKNAIGYFTNAIALKKNLPGLKDSILFKPMVYCGNSYYQLDNLDSAEYFYKKAEQIAEAYPEISEKERLFNTLGIIAYATGNYNKSITYYQKAVSTLKIHPRADNLLLVTYQNNLALAYRKLLKFDQALEIYRQLLPYHIETDKLNHNIGSVYLAMGQSAQAIVYLNQVRYIDQRKLNDLGRAYFEHKDDKQALQYLQQAITLNANHRNSDNGITLKYIGDVLAQEKQFSKALWYYQQAIINLQFDFHAANIYVNPIDYTGVFNTVELLETLLAKAKAFDLLYRQDKQVKNLNAALQTYLSFYKLADHIEHFYETDDARLLISDRKYISHKQSIDICFELYRLTHDKNYIEQAFVLDEENKANTLAINLEEENFKAHSRISPSLLKQETALKEDITRDALKASGITDNSALNRIKAEINDRTIQLIKVRQHIDEQIGLNRKNFNGENISVQALQKIVPQDGAILSYHLGDSSLLCFMITADKFSFFSKPLTKQFLASLKQIDTQLQHPGNSSNRELKSESRQLYDQLIKPAESFLDGKSDLMIIPDDELNYLPFELLTNDDGETLLSKYNITYNYSFTILQSTRGNTGAGENSVLGMAPFDAKLPGTTWQQLPASRQEINGLKGSLFYNTQATKKQFLSSAQNFNIIHLATHAYANGIDPNQSFIAFYPTLPDSTLNYKLYLPEIYNLKLAKTRLVVLSACESGTGELVKGEGLMSLSRAFSYAGCNNIITSMWKADDASTAYISGRLHYYLQKGYSISSALRQARLDYLADDGISPAKKQAGYWAHLRLTGNFEKQPGHNYWIYIIAVVIAVAAYGAAKSRKQIKRSRLT